MTYTSSLRDALSLFARLNDAKVDTASAVDSLMNIAKDELKSLMNNTLNSIAKQQSEIQSIQEDLLQEKADNQQNPEEKKKALNKIPDKWYQLFL